MKESGPKRRAGRKPNGTGKVTVVHTPNNPIIVSPANHRAKGQHIAPPAPKIEVKPEPIPIPPGMKITRIQLNISRWSHDGDNLFND